MIYPVPQEETIEFGDDSLMCRNDENESEILPVEEDVEEYVETRDTVPSEQTDEASEESEGVTPASSEVTDEHATLASEKKAMSLTRNVFEYLELFVCSISIVFLVFMFGVRLCDVTGESMEKTLYEKEKLLISDLFYEPERGDIIVFHQTGEVLNEPVVKRVIATGGESVVLSYKSNPQSITVTVRDKNGKEIVVDETTYAYYDGTKPGLYNGQESIEYRVPEGYLFVMGDNRNNSADSRSSVIGLVDERRVLGRVIIRVYPFARFGAID